MLALTDGEQHEWDGMRFPLAIGPKKTAGEGSLPELISWVRRNRATLLDLVARNGAVLLRDFGGLADAAGFSELVHALQLEGFASGCSAAPRTEQAPGVFTANEAPPQEPIPFHHEMAQCEQPPSYICFFCEVAPPSGGATPIIPSHQVADYLRRTHPQFAAKLAQLGVRYVRILPEETDLTSPLGKSWKATFNVNTREDAEAAMRAAGVEWEWREGGDLKTISKPMAALITNKANGRETFFNAIVAASTGWVDKRNQPEKAVSAPGCILGRKKVATRVGQNRHGWRAQPDFLAKTGPNVPHHTCSPSKSTSPEMIVSDLPGLRHIGNLW